MLSKTKTCTGTKLSKPLFLKSLRIQPVRSEAMQGADADLEGETFEQAVLVSFSARIAGLCSFRVPVSRGRAAGECLKMRGLAADSRTDTSRSCARPACGPSSTCCTA